MCTQNNDIRKNWYSKNFHWITSAIIILAIIVYSSFTLINPKPANAHIICEPCHNTAKSIRYDEYIKTQNPNLTPGEIYEIGRTVLKYSELRDLDPYLVLAIIMVESSANYDAVSAKGAIGLMQIMPFWIDELQITGDLFVIDRNVDAGTFILSEYIRVHGRDAGIQRYFWGGVKPDGTYLAKVERVLSEMQVDA